MKNLLAGFFGTHISSKPGRAAVQTAAPETRDSPVTIEDGSENATRRQLIQVLLRDVLRKSGIPPAWVECQMLLVSSRSRGHGMYVRLVIKHWDERLMQYAFAFQQTLLADIERFEPDAESWLHGISWDLDVKGQCPYTTLPDKSFWEVPVEKAPAAYVGIPEVLDDGVFQPPIDEEETTRAKDIAKLFAIRDQELDREAAEGLAPADFQKTQPSPL
ncbi:MAG: hypothetical protein V4614_00335 [Pseudomonadota bacterium]